MKPKKKGGLVTYSRDQENEIDKIFIIFLGSHKWFQFKFKCSRLYIYNIHQLGGPYWEKLYPRQRAQFFPIQTDLGWQMTFLFFFLKPNEILHKTEPE